MFQAHGFPVLPGVAVGHKRWHDAPEQVADELEGKLTYPMFVKPANLGSSIGISRATDRASLRQAMEVAYHYDSRVLVEQGVESPMEINCSVLGIGGDCEASLCEQPVSWQEMCIRDRSPPGAWSWESSPTCLNSLPIFRFHYCIASRPI